MEYNKDGQGPAGREAIVKSMARPDTSVEDSALEIKASPKGAVVGKNYVEHGSAKETAKVGNCRFSVSFDLIEGGTNGSQSQVLPRRESGPRVVVVGGNHGENGSTWITTKADRVPAGREAIEKSMARPDILVRDSSLETKASPKGAVVGKNYVEHGSAKETAKVGKCRFSVCMVSGEEESTRKSDQLKSHIQAMAARSEPAEVAAGVPPEPVRVVLKQWRLTGNSTARLAPEP